MYRSVLHAVKGSVIDSNIGNRLLIKLFILKITKILKSGKPVDEKAILN
jgi:hypothetical protein